VRKTQLISRRGSYEQEVASRANVVHLHRRKQCNSARIAHWQAMQSGPNCRMLVGWLRPQAPENQSLRSVVVSYSCVIRLSGCARNQKKKSPCASYHAANAETAMNKYEALKRMHHQYACDQKASVFISFFSFYFAY
jgi:uncharacterized protein YceK